MDEAFNAHSRQARRQQKTRSSPDLQHLSLAPLTSRLAPLAGADGLQPSSSHGSHGVTFATSSSHVRSSSSSRHVTYLEGRSAPTTPGLLSGSSGHHHHTANSARPRHSSVGPRGGILRLDNHHHYQEEQHMTKSKSASHLAPQRHGDVGGSHSGKRRAVSGTATPSGGNRRSHGHGHGHGHGPEHGHHYRGAGSGNNHSGRHSSSILGGSDYFDSDIGGAYNDDWLLRAGALLADGARESKGQAWLVSRASSTSLTGEARDAASGSDDDDALQERRRSSASSSVGARTNSVPGSRRASVPDVLSSPVVSRYGSRSHSRAGSHRSAGGGGVRGAMHLTSLERDEEGVTFTGIPVADCDGDDPPEDEDDPDYIAGPDFVGLDERLEALGRGADTEDDDEAAVRRLVRGKAGGTLGGGWPGGKAGLGDGPAAWVGGIFGWGLSSVAEDDDENSENSDEVGDDDGHDVVDADVDRTKSGSDPDDMSGDCSGEQNTSTATTTIAGGIHPQIPPPKEDEGGWQDAAWLLSVASKVFL